MKDFVIILGSSSTISTPPTSLHNQQHPSKPKKPNSSLNKLSPSKKHQHSIPAVHSHKHSSYPHLSSSVRWDPNPGRRNSPLKHYAELASKLAEDGRLEDFRMIVEMVVASGANASRFVSMLNIDFVSKGVALSVREGKVKSVVEALKKVEKLGVPPMKLVDGRGLDSMKGELRRIVGSGQVEEAVDLLEVLRGN